VIVSYLTPSVRRTRPAFMVGRVVGVPAVEVRRAYRVARWSVGPRGARCVALAQVQAMHAVEWRLIER
jgi:hypothetical protein